MVRKVMGRNNMVSIVTHRATMSVTISTSISALLIFSSEESLGGPPKRKDMVTRVDVCCG